MAPTIQLSADDRLDIVELVARYGHVLDDRNWEAFPRIFTADAVVDFSAAGFDLVPITGLSDIVHHYRDVWANLHPLQHVLTSSIIEEATDEGVVVRSKALYPLPGNLVFEGLYENLVVRTTEGWRISRMSTSRIDDSEIVGGISWGAQS